MRFASTPPAVVAGDQPTATRRTGNLGGPSSSKRVSPSLHVTGSVYFSVWTFTPSARKAPTPHSTALAICGDPVTRPPTSSVRRRRFSSIGDEPITIGRIFAAASAHDDASVAEQPAFPCALCAGLNGSFFAGGNCAHPDGIEVKKQRNMEIRKTVRRGMGLLSFPGIST